MISHALRSVLLLLAAATLASAAAAQDTTAARRPPAVSRTPEGIELNFQDADLRAVLGALADIAGLNVVYGTLPQRTVTLRTSRPIAVAEARAYLESVVRTNGLTMTEEGGLIRISGEPARAPEPAVPATRAAPQERARLFVYRLNHAQADALAATLADLYGIGRSSSVASEREPRALSEELRDQRLAPGFPTDPPAGVPRPGVPPGGVEGTAQELAAALRGPVQIVPDPRTNALLIRAGQTDYETIRAAIQELDVRPLQVMIEVLIAEVRRDRQLAVGINADIPQRRIGDGPTTIGGEVTGPSAGDLAVRILNIGGLGVDAVLRALSTSGDVAILSRPIVLAQNNQEARILVGSERPFIQLFRALPTDAAVRDQVVQYRDVGTQLTIRPTINPDGYVTLSVLQEVSNATAETQFGAPIISTREARTQLLVRDGRTAVIGGLVDQQRETSAGGIPFLKDIPGIGALFRTSQSRRRNVTELFLFLTPRVLRTDEDIDEATRRLRDGTQRLRHEVKDPISLLGPDGTTPVPTPPARPPARPEGTP